MRTRTRSSQLATATAATFVALSGCAVSSGQPESGSGDGITLSFWSYYSGTQQTWLEEQVATFEEKNPDVTIQLVETVGDQQDQRLLASVSTGTTPDLFINNIVVDYPTLVAGGVMEDLTPYWDDFADKDQFPDAAVWRSDGRVYNLLPYTNLLGMYYNEDILSEYGITTPPSTLDELGDDLATVTADGTYKGLALSASPDVEGAWLFAPQLLGQGINYCNFTVPEVTGAFQRWDDWSQEGYIPLSAATWDQNAAWQQFMSGDYAFALNGNWQLGNVASADFEYGTAPYPAPAGGESIVFPGGEGFAIGAGSEHPDVAWQFLEEMILSNQGGESIYTASGSIPVRADVTDMPAIQDDPYVQPYVAAAQTAADWPDNTNTAEMQNRLGQAVSNVVSGQTSAQQAAESAATDIEESIASGEGGCE